MSNPFRAPTRPEVARYKARIDALRGLGYNFDPEQRHTFTEADGWRFDEYEIALPPEAPGPPAPDGSFELAKGVIERYDFPDPDLITGLYVPDDPLPGRPMILRGRFLGFTFWFGVQIGEVIDEQRVWEEEPARVWGFNYRTLEGHFEQGEIHFEVWKGLDSGRVRFRIHAYSRTGRIRNPFYWLGFKFFGRYLQVRFAEKALERVNQYVVEGLAARQAAVPAKPRDTVRVQTVTDEAAAQLEEIEDRVDGE